MTVLSSRVVAILQARMQSSRLPGKVLLPIAGKPMIAWIVERVSRSRWVDELVLATSIEKQDDPLEEFAVQSGVPCFRGSEGDVLDRYYHAAQLFAARVVVRLTADNPIVDAGFMDWVIKEYLESEADYVAAVPGKEHHLPMGLATEVFSFAALESSWRNDTHPEWREHVTQHIRRNSDLFQIRYLRLPSDYSELRLTVDTPDDLQHISRVFQHFGRGDFSWKEALDFCASELKA